MADSLCKCGHPEVDHIWRGPFHYCAGCPGSYCVEWRGPGWAVGSADKPENVKKRMREYADKTAPLKQYRIAFDRVQNLEAEIEILRAVLGRVEALRERWLITERALSIGTTSKTLRACADQLAEALAGGPDGR